MSLPVETNFFSIENFILEELQQEDCNSFEAWQAPPAAGGGGDGGWDPSDSPDSSPSPQHRPQQGQQQLRGNAKIEEEQRKERNRQAAKQSRRKKKEQERKMQETLRHLAEANQQLVAQAEKFESLYFRSLHYLGSQSAFLRYLRENPGLVQNPDSRPVLRRFVNTGYGGLA